MVFINFPSEQVEYLNKGKNWYFRETYIPLQPDMRIISNSIIKHISLPIFYPILLINEKEEIIKRLPRIPLLLEIRSIVKRRTISTRKKRYVKIEHPSVQIEYNNKFSVPEKIISKYYGNTRKLYINYNIDINDELFSINTNKFKRVIRETETSEIKE